MRNKLTTKKSNRTSWIVILLCQFEIRLNCIWIKVRVLYAECINGKKENIVRNTFFETFERYIVRPLCSRRKTQLSTLTKTFIDDVRKVHDAIRIGVEKKKIEEKPFNVITTTRDVADGVAEII